MSAPDVGREVIDRFAALAGDAHLTVILGAGASAPSGLPQWNEFATRLAVSSALVADEHVARILLEKQDPSFVLEAARSKAGEAWGPLVHDALFSIAINPAPSPLHLAAAGHFYEMPATTTLATLNFDTLLESAVLSTGAPAVVIDADGETDPHAPTVHHLHGAVFNGEAYETVVGYRDFAELVANEDAWQKAFLSDALERGPLLLAGTSYRDPDIRHWLHLIMRDEQPVHPAIVTIVREGLGLDRDSFSAIEDALLAEWEAVGLSALPMQDVADAAVVIRELRHIGSEGYLSPQERSQAIWRAHSTRFSELQETYSRALAADGDQMSTALGSTVHRATLWLADGRGKLARWATEGGNFAGVRGLKRVPTGHDSPWIAGEALASEDVKLKDIERDHRVSPTWRSVLAIPIFVGDERLPDVATATVTFGLGQTSSSILSRQDDWRETVEGLSSAWGSRIRDVAYG